MASRVCAPRASSNIANRLERFEPTFAPVVAGPVPATPIILALRPGPQPRRRRQDKPGDDARALTENPPPHPRPAVRRLAGARRLRMGSRKNSADVPPQTSISSQPLTKSKSSARQNLPSPQPRLSTAVMLSWVTAGATRACSQGTARLDVAVAISRTLRAAERHKGQGGKA
jgi:hypothetical protein